MRSDRQHALELRLSGRSYQEISQRLGVPKSTLSGWFHVLPVNERLKVQLIDRAREVWARNIRVYNRARALRITEIHHQRQRDAARTVGEVNRRELFLLGVALYWAEGYKRSRSTVQWCNSDPDMVRFMMVFFRCFAPAKVRMRYEVYIHSNVCTAETKQFWSKIAGVRSTDIRVRSYQSSASRSTRPKNQLPYGTFRINSSSPEFWDCLMGSIRGLAAWSSSR